MGLVDFDVFGRKLIGDFAIDRICAFWLVISLMLCFCLVSEKNVSKHFECEVKLGIRSFVSFSVLSWLGNRMELRISDRKFILLDSVTL
jgi:hypothetical protein